MMFPSASLPGADPPRSTYSRMRLMTPAPFVAAIPANRFLCISSRSPIKTAKIYTSWAGTYKDLDKVWLASGALEIPAYKQLADPKSDLSVTGRDLCARIEEATEKPTFYYLTRYLGCNDGEAMRPCPLCGGEWRLSDQNADMSPFHKFQFKCDSCRLVSRIADSYEDERRARIGEYKRRAP
jgi:predicted  nucleic acid-binding Zn ribbon protein